MNIRSFLILPFALSFLFLPFMSNTASALTRFVVKDRAQCPADPVLNPCYPTVSDAVAAALAGDSIEIRPGTHAAANVIINVGLSSIYGLETATTVLDGGAGTRILSVENVANTISIRNLTFSNATTGIVINNTPSAQIKSNIFELGRGSTAVQTIVSSTSTVANNTFYRNGTGIFSDLTTLNIINNIFSQDSGATAIIPSNMDLTQIRNNLFFGGAIGPPVVTVTTTPIASSDPNWQGNISVLDPLFVAAASKDFHVISGSPCRDTGNTSEGADRVDGTQADIGAYGGSNSDTIPFTVSGLVSSSTGTTPATITLSWAANSAYTVKGYNIYYGYAPGVYNGTDAILSGGTTSVGPRVDAGNMLTRDLIVSRAAVSTAPPALNSSPPPLSEGLKLSWSHVAGATGYNIYYSLASAPTLTLPAISVSGGDTTAYTLRGLVNGELYNIAVTAVTQANYYFAVTAYDTTWNSATGTPGVAHESDYSAETSVQVGSIAESGYSNVVTGMPEPISSFPDLPDTGCFIATAAYGSPLAPAVQVLREFRDRFLVTNAPGRAFVGWYYANAPVAARYLNEHPSLKPLAQTALAPAFAAALFFTRTDPVFQTAVLVALILLAAVLHRRRTRIPSKETTC